MSDELHDLEHYALKGSDYGRLTGVSLACHAMPDCFLLMHVGVGCKNKATAHLLSHDWQEHGNLREAWTEVGDRDLILGASARVGPYLRTWQERMQPELMVVVTVTFLSLAGEDLADEVDKAAKELPCRVMTVPAPGYDGDLWLGYATVLHAIAKDLDWKGGGDRRGEATVLGYFFDRYEGDHAGNLRQLEGLLKAVGVKLAATLFSGRGYRELEEAHRSEFVIELPYTGPLRKKFKRTLKRRSTIQVDLPMGLRGTSRWLREVGSAVGAAPARTEAWIEAREKRVQGQLANLSTHWQGLRLAVFAEVPLAAGVCSLLLDLGIQPVFVGLRGTSLGGELALRTALDRDGHALPDDALVLEAPSLDRLRTEMGDGIAEGRIDGAIGSATELHTLTTLKPRELLRDHLAGRVAPQGPLLVEMGFPAKNHHVIHPMPFLGYGGVVVMAQRLLSAPRLWDAGRRQGLFR